uniref:Rab-GAP TBC domain-containing protein n=1 Tax=Meloidogyne hapla TaxID=6305 RepID=A0A1I8B2J2_MELHA
MRSMRVFYSNPERTCGQLVIASYDSQYKIFHFHHDGLDKLAIIFERWNAVKARSAGNDSPSVAGPDRHLIICPVGADLAKTEMDPEDGLYERLDWDHWRSFVSNEGNVGDSFTVRKDVLRTDRRNSFFAGDGNANLETMKSILLTYAVRFPEINYIQGMSDLLAPLLFTLQDEPLAYWCFTELMKQTLFCQSDQRRSVMEIQLDYLRELIRLFVPEFLGGDAPSLMFVHRWILLFFKREFPQAEALHIWEACWSRYRSAHFHLFVACAIVSVFAPDVVSQRLPNDEILLYFSSLAMHMDANLILKKARGLLYKFHRMHRIPCILAGLQVLEEYETKQWNSHVPIQKEYFCTGTHGNELCPLKLEEQSSP